MVDLSTYGLTIGRSVARAAAWFAPVLSRGRGAVFVDTGFLRALFDGADQYASLARTLFDETSANFYTTDLVLAEVVRQIAIKDGIDHPTRERWFNSCTDLLVDSGTILVCVPPADVLFKAYDELRVARNTDPRLDLCDLLSVTVLDYAQHRRVFGFDRHYGIFGAQLEPLSP